MGPKMQKIYIEISPSPISLLPHSQDLGTACFQLANFPLMPQIVAGRDSHFAAVQQQGFPNSFFFSDKEKSERDFGREAPHQIVK